MKKLIFTGTAVKKSFRLFLLLALSQLIACATTAKTSNADSLSYAAFYGKLDDVKAILASGLTIDAKDSRDTTALYSAVEAEQQDVVAYLIRQGADVNFETGEDYPPLFNLCYHYTDTDYTERKLNIAKLLVNAGAKVDAVSGGKTLIASCQEDGANKAIISYLKSRLKK